MSDAKTILIVDDDPDLSQTYELVLSAAGYNTLVAADSIEGEAIAKEQNPDLILLDIVMEEVDAGLVFAERFATTYPIILLSSIADTSVKVFDAHELSVKSILQKPIEPAALRDAVRMALEV
jgi:DNA-binding response OmpR family regulator